MMNDPQYTTLPISPDVFWPLMLLLGVALFSWLLVGLMPKREEGTAEKARGLDALVEQIGLARGWVGPVVFALFVLLAIVGVSLFELTRSYFFVEEFKPERFGIFASIVTAFIAGLFLGWRNLVLGRQANIQDQALFNDKINAASEDLAARRQVTRVVHDKDGIETILTEWKDDLVARAAAIDRLHGLAQERPEATPRIARQLSIYVRELSREFPAENPPGGVSPNEVREWAMAISPVRPDMEKAVQVIGRLRSINDHGLTRGDIDLRTANLQGFDLNHLDFTDALFEKADMQGVNLRYAQMERADFFAARLEGANFRITQMQGANLSVVQMKGADLRWAQMEGADLSWARMEGVDLHRAQMKGVDLSWTQIDKDTNLIAARLRGAALKANDDTTVEQLRLFWHEVFADGTVQLPEGEARPEHWAEEELNFSFFDAAWKAWRDTLPEEESP